MSTQEDVKATTPPVQGEDATKNTSPASAGTPTPDFREDIAQSLSEGTAPEPALPSEPPKPPEVKSEAPKPEAEAPATKPPEAPARHPMDEDDDEVEVDPKYTKIRAGIDKLRTKLRKAREHGQYGQLLSATASKAGMTPEVMARWVELGAGVNANDPKALADFNQFLRNTGFVKPDPAPAAPAAPTPPPATELADKIYREDFAEDVKNYLVSEEVARAKALKAANRIALSQPANPKPQPQQPQQPVPQQDGQPQFSPLEREALGAVGRMEADFASKLPDWNTKLKAEVQAEIRARRARDGGISAVYWLTDFTDAVNTVRAKHAQAAPAAPVQVDDTLRTTSKRPRVAEKKTFAATREQIAAALMSGGAGLDDLITPQ